VTAQSASLTITRGTPVTDLLTVTGLGGFFAAVDLTCTVSSSVTNTTCTLSPSSVNPGGTATLTVTANALSAQLRSDPFLHLAWQLASGLVFAAGLFLSQASRKRPRRGKLSRLGSLISLLVICLLLGTVSCGGGSNNPGSQQQPSPQPQSGTVTVQASSGSLNHTVQISVTVN
jgi:hypothetical protein